MLLLSRPHHMCDPLCHCTRSGENPAAWKWQLLRSQIVRDNLCHSVSQFICDPTSERLLTVISHIDDATLCYYEQHSCCVKVTPAESRGKGVREWSMRGRTHWSTHPSTYLSIFDHIWAHLNTFIEIEHILTFWIEKTFSRSLTSIISRVSLQLVWNEGIGHKGSVILSLVPPFQMAHSSLILSWGDGDGVEWMNRP